MTRSSAIAAALTTVTQAEAATEAAAAAAVDRAGSKTTNAGRRATDRGKLVGRQPGLPGVGRRPGNGGRWGGRREGAGRKPSGHAAGVVHARRPALSPKLPLHITVRLAPGLPRLRRRAGYRIARRALGLANRFPGARLCHVSIQANHLHFIVETDDRGALTRAMRSFGISFARNVNADLALGRRRGRVLADRYHVVVLRTPAQTRAALEYVLGNWRRHREDDAGPRRRTDRFSSGPYFTGWDTAVPDFLWWKDLPWPEDGPLPIRLPRSWLLTVGWKRGGLLSPWHRPGPVAATARPGGRRTA